MSRCIELARKGAGNAAPNPMVGAVIVHNGEIIGEGYHQKCGEAHAEINAINSVKDKSLLKESIIYVCLEPCSHFGKTPPCALKIIECEIPRVVVGHNDPFPKVMGGGIKMLRDNGVEVIADVLHDECAELNKRFFTFHEKKRPYIILKWAESNDGFIDRIRTKNEKPTTISNKETQKLLHQLRAEESAIMVGTNTAMLDNPSLTVRYAEGNNPVRIVIDRKLKIPQNINLFNNEAKTIVFTEKNAVSSDNIQYIKIDFNKNILPQIMTELYHQNLLSLIVEGGSTLLNSFIQDDLWDEARIETNSTLNLKTGIKAPVLKNGILFDEEKFGDNFIRRFRQ